MQIWWSCITDMPSCMTHMTVVNELNREDCMKEMCYQGGEVFGYKWNNGSRWITMTVLVTDVLFYCLKRRNLFFYHFLSLQSLLWQTRLVTLCKIWSPFFLLFQLKQLAEALKAQETEVKGQIDKEILIRQQIHVQEKLSPQAQSNLK